MINKVNEHNNQLTASFQHLNCLHNERLIVHLISDNKVATYANRH